MNDMNHATPALPRSRRSRTSFHRDHDHAVGSVLVVLLTAVVASAGVSAVTLGGNVLFLMVAALVLGIAGLVGAVHA